jgi:TonB family protein
VSGEMPFYPPLARQAHIEGDIRLRVTTDGLGIASVVVESGQPMLARAAQDNVRTWKFASHEPTVFFTRFSYRLTSEETCEHDEPNNGEVVLKLPTEIHVTSRALVHAHCDPDAGLDLSEPLRVFLTGCQVDGLSVSCERMKIQLHSGDLTLKPQMLKEADGNQSFVVPKEFRSLKSFDLIVDTSAGGFTLTDLDGHFLKGKWRIGVDHAPFKEDTGVYDTPDDVRCLGFIHFQWGEPEPIAWHVCR